MTFKPGDLVRLDSSVIVFPTIVSIAPFRCRIFHSTREDEGVPGVAVGTLKVDDDDCVVVLHRSRVLITYPHRWRPL